MGPTGVDDPEEAPESAPAVELVAAGAARVPSELDSEVDGSDELDSDDAVVRLRRVDEERVVGVLAPNELKYIVYVVDTLSHEGMV
jgi:hypothetical protein